MMLPFEQVSDIETMTMEEEQRFEQELSEHFLQEEEKHGICCHKNEQKNSILQAPEINWNANVWFLELFHFSKERMNPSKPIELVSFKEVTNACPP